MDAGIDFIKTLSIASSPRLAIIIQIFFLNLLDMLKMVAAFLRSFPDVIPIPRLKSWIGFRN